MEQPAAKIQYIMGLTLMDGIFLLFLGLKLCGVIGWSWWWITAPQWIPITFRYLSIVIVKMFSKKKL